MSGESEPFITYKGVLEWLQGQSPAAPRDISESFRRENVIRYQCRELCECGLAECVTHDVYAITERGIQYLTADLELPEKDGDLDVDELREQPRWQEEARRITDFSGIDAETIKQFNFERYQDPEDKYGLVQESREKTVQRIWNVADCDLNRVMREFPRNEPVVQQCAHWVRAMTGKHFFPDANHRTAMGSLRAILELNQITPPRWPGRELDRMILKAKFIRNFVVDVRFDNLWQKDELYHLWHRHFRNLFYDLENTKHHERSTAHLRRALDAARNQG